MQHTCSCLSGWHLFSSPSTLLIAFAFHDIRELRLPTKEERRRTSGFATVCEQSGSSFAMWERLVPWNYKCVAPKRGAANQIMRCWVTSCRQSNYQGPALILQVYYNNRMGRHEVGMEGLWLKHSLMHRWATTLRPPTGEVNNTNLLVIIQRSALHVDVT